MRVCLVPHQYPPDFGGVASASERYAQGLLARGHEVLSVCVDRDLPPHECQRGTQQGVACLRIGAHRRRNDTNTSWFESIVAAHAENPFDVIVGRYLNQAAFVAVFTARFLGLPSLVSARGNDLDRGVFDETALPGLLWSLNHASAVSAVSSELARKISALAPAVTPRVIHNGVDGERFCPRPVDSELERALGLDGEPTLAFFGEARIKKGLPVLLAAYADLLAQGMRAQLLLVGGVRESDAPLLEVFRRQQPAARVTVVPPVAQHELARYYALASVVVLPSLRDGLPNALLEAMACARPVVASRVGGIPEVVRDGVDGVLVAPANAAALADSVGDLLANPTRAAALGAEARLRVCEHFTLERERSADLTILEGLLKPR
ncbi:MAG TPA: glycosyltransferase family 4 protein [Polyangiaceae bacterium]|nr:glycosyltransferase family 4 protein [Polyangiaceae bacterium]